MAYRLKITETAKKDLLRLPGHLRQRARKLIDSLAHNPVPAEAKELRDLPGRYRVRLERWRVIYRVEQDELTVLVLRVPLKTGPETYQNLEEP